MCYRLLGLLLLALSLPTWATERVALVIGNSAYQHTSRLNNPGNDAADMTALLREIGFAVTTVHDASRDDFEEALIAFGRRAERAEIALVFFAGHGIQVDGRNYLLPIEAALDDERDLRRLIALDDVLYEVGQAQRLGVAIIDACRDNPLARQLARSVGAQRSAAIGRGLSRVERPPSDVLVAFATEADATAADGSGRNSPYTAALKQHLATPDLEVRLLFGQVRDSVMRTTGNRQRPYTYGSLGGQAIYLAGGSLRIDEPAAPARRGRLTITSQPPGAAIYLDGALLGDAPQRYPAPREGTQQVELEARLDGYRTRTERVWLRAGQDSSVRLLLQAEAPAVEPEPRWISSARVNIRSGPGTGHGVVTQLTQGTEVLWLGPSGRDRTWQRIRLDDGREAYVHGGLLSTRAVAAAPPPPTPPSSRPPPGAPDMVLIRGGTFTMGSPTSETGRNPVGDGERERRHRVSVDDFHLARYTVTVGEFRRFVESSGYRTEAERNVREAGCFANEGGDWAWRAGRGWRNPGFSQSDRHPVVCVSWNDALAYIEWLNQQTGRRYRLPTEAEWEYAARAGTTTARYWGNDPNRACRYANVHDETSRRVNQFGWEHHRCDDGYAQTAPVGSFEPNAWGLYDMLGNVWEWTCSEFDRDYGGAETRCVSNNRSNARRVIWGGSWNVDPSGVRSAYRLRDAPDTRSYNGLGLRLARSP